MEISIDAIHVLGHVDGDEFFEQLAEAGVPSFEAAIGPDLVLHANGRNMVCRQNVGSCSLAIQLVDDPFEVYVSERGQVRAMWSG